MFATHGRPDQSINVLDRLDLRSDDTHPFHDTRLWSSSSIVSTVYNTVILAADPDVLFEHSPAHNSTENVSVGVHSDTLGAPVW